MIKLNFVVLGVGVRLHVEDAETPFVRRKVSLAPRGSGRAEVGILTFIDRVCPKCNFDQPRRMPRMSWLARRVMPYFGCYPWECPMCRIQFYRKNRVEQVQRLESAETEFGRSGLTR
jgi:rubredoxin